MKINFSKQAKKAIKLIQKTNKNVFITGKAGTGKSTLLEYLRNNATEETIVLAPTGIAAINVKGDTIHSFFRMKPGFEKEETEKMRLNAFIKEKYQKIKTIFIDEISMVRADLLDAIDIYLRRTRMNDSPFGDVQMVFFGDLYQLPPVVTFTDREKFYAEYASPYFFEAKVFQGSHSLFSASFKMETVELDKIYRQTDDEFIDVLNAVRDNSATLNHLNKLNERFDLNFVPEENEKYIHLVTTNADAAKINNAHLKKLDTKEEVFTANFSENIAKNLHPNDDEITVKIGSQIMFIYNDPKRRWVNGTIGKVIDIYEKYNEEKEANEKTLRIEKSDGKIVETSDHTWEISRYIFQDGKFEREIIGSFEQIPLKLAWAITIHKSQGKTFNKVIIDMGRGSFVHGQTYVALSRCTSLEGIVLKKKLYKSGIIMDQRVASFM